MTAPTAEQIRVKNKYIHEMRVLLKTADRTATHWDVALNANQRRVVLIAAGIAIPPADKYGSAGRADLAFINTPYRKHTKRDQRRIAEAGKNMRALFADVDFVEVA